MPNALVFSVPAALRFQAGVDIADNWSSSYQFSSNETDIKSVCINNAIFVFRDTETTIAPSIVIRLEDGKLFSCFHESAARLEALKRAIDAGIMVIEGGGVLPAYWRPFTGDRFMTFQALPISKGDARRLVLWRRLPPLADPCVFIFDVTKNKANTII